VKLVAVTGASKRHGYLTDVHRIARMAHAHGAKLLIDGAQVLAHAPVDVLPNDDPATSTFFAGAGTRRMRRSGRRSCSAPRTCSTRRPPTSPPAARRLRDEDEAYYKKSPDRHEVDAQHRGGRGPSRRRCVS